MEFGRTTPGVVHTTDSVLTKGYTGLLGEDDNGATDLGTLEKKLAEKQQSRQASQAASNPTSPSQAASGHDNASTPQSSLTSPEPGHKEDKRHSLTPEKDRKEEEEVAALSEMMCSLVTNNSGETRYIGMQAPIPNRPPAPL